MGSTEPALPLCARDPKSRIPAFPQNLVKRIARACAKSTFLGPRHNPGRKSLRLALVRFQRLREVLAEILRVVWLFPTMGQRHAADRAGTASNCAPIASGAKGIGRWGLRAALERPDWRDSKPPLSSHQSGFCAIRGCAYRLCDEICLGLSRRQGESEAFWLWARCRG